MVRETVQLKKEAFRVMLAGETPEAVARYQQACRMAASVVTEAKQKMLEKFGEHMVKDF